MYRTPAQLPAGAVLVVGSAQSGVQIVEDLQAAGREVFLSTSRAGRLPRRYRGRDFFDWMILAWELGPQVGMSRKTVSELPSPAARFASNPQLTGRDGGHEVNLRRLGRQGVVLLGRVESASGKRLRLASDVPDNMRFADEWAVKAKADADRLIDLLGLDVPAAAADAPINFQPPAISELDLDSAGISTVIWATGYRPAFDWIDLPVFDAYGYPQQQRGVADFPGLYFLGLPWLHVQSSSLLYGVGEDAAYLAGWIADCQAQAAA